MALSPSIIAHVPKTPGIYKMLDHEGRIIYVGKAKELQARVRTYFQKDYAHSTRTRKLLETAQTLEYIQTDSELEALLLENNLIKELRPRYNILMKDDKSYVYIKVDMGEDFPRIRIIREKNIELDRAHSPKARYFGPKLATSKVYETLRILKKLFPFRHCQLDITWRQEATGNGGQNEKREHGGADLVLSPNKDLVEVKNKVIDYPCIDYFIKRCPGPCIGAVSPDEYRKIIHKVVAFLEGKTDEIERQLRGEMADAASKKLFEKAARIRDKLIAIESITEKQKVTALDRKDTDAINCVLQHGHVYFSILMIRDGKLINHENFTLDGLDLVDETNKLDFAEVLESFLTQYYEKTLDIPREILIPDEVFSRDTVEKWLTEKKSASVKLVIPQRGEKNKLLELAYKNALSFAKESRIRWLAKEQQSQAAERLSFILSPFLSPQKPLKLSRLEGFDISHLGGNETVGSMVVFEKGTAKSADYRHFKIRTVSGKPDDYKCMEEVLTRRLKYLRKPEKLSLRKASKKHAEIIKKWGTECGWKELMETPDWKNFYILTKNKTPAAMIRLLELEKGIFEVSGVYVAPEYRGEKLSFSILERLIASVKNKKARFYTQVESRLLDHYLTFGFTPINDAPKIIKDHTAYWEELDKVKYTIIAYYKGKKKPDDPSFKARPDLLVIDGGKGQLASAVNALKKLNVEIPVISLAKRLEEIFVPGQSAPILLEEGDEALKLLQRIRDESHRFAITFQRSLHRKYLLNG